jgi:hypothetical protein
MKRQKPYTIMMSLAVLGVVLAFAGCDKDESGDTSISEITVSNIPVNIPVDNGGESNPAFKIYLNASDSQNVDDPPAAQGFKKFFKEDGVTLNDGVTASGNTYTITIPLRKPKINIKDKPGYDPTLDPNEDNGPWSGTAGNFSLMIAPQDVSGGVNVIWVKGNMGFDKSKAQLDWNGSSLMDFRNASLASFRLSEKAQALFDDIVCRDPDITSE